ncbi:uncharacterized protein SPPG_06451 [Spizellomyces punctatus DAOM BR117]|uniref:Uncharacterized protein n=1 Tax=Spizellomyces punctatus (strain DAOM BR117) TaxID=645134 RepID=A0A0L0HBD0_SPIPD|nr:uncharacterized protein SPPG_06451 [Spizellomyces punctatus DAOM BR117]KNC98033.1 hypothetical protein SPPG_06451 [Spizellomyces punctatus DAOM BR117]|eukprot:XP_016606073.1 hypothetical protein SPPG_06451 [Spizellomyces punctatus DAOM BR117]
MSSGCITMGKRLPFEILHHIVYWADGSVRKKMLFCKAFNRSVLAFRYAESSLVHRQFLVAAFQEAFLHNTGAVPFQRIVRTGLAILEGHELEYRTLDAVTELATAIDPTLSPDAAEIIASSLQFWRMKITKSHGDPNRVVSTMLGQVGRSSLVEDGDRILFRWYKNSDGEIKSPIICSIIRDTLVDATDFKSVLWGLAMVPREVRKFYFWAHLPPPEDIIPV